MSDILGAARNAYDKARAEIGHGLDKAKAEVGSTRAGAELLRYGDKMADAAKELAGEVESLQHKVAELTEDKRRMLREFEAEKKQALVGAMSRKLSRAIDELMNVLAVKVKAALVDDPYMPAFVKSSIRNIVDSIWPSWATALREAIFSVAINRQPLDHGTPPCCWGALRDSACCDCYARSCEFYGPVAWVRYHFLPYDASIWKLLRRWQWWLLTLISIIPRYGVTHIFFALWFLIMDRSDEFQLVNYIATFKSLQFVGLGVVGSLVAAVQLMICVSWQDSASLCPTIAPQSILFEVFLFALQTVLVWCAFMFIPSSTQKGGLYYQLSREREKDLEAEAKDPEKTLLKAMAADTIEASYFESRSDDTDARRRLMKLLIYDSVVFSVCVLLAIWAAFANALDESASVENFNAEQHLFQSANFKFGMALYYIKALFGLMSFPFVALLIPGISALFSKAKATGYSRYGNVVPALRCDDPNPVPWRRADPCCCCDDKHEFVDVDAPPPPPPGGDDDNGVDVCLLPPTGPSPSSPPPPSLPPPRTYAAAAAVPAAAPAPAVIVASPQSAHASPQSAHASPQQPQWG